MVLPRPRYVELHPPQNLHDTAPTTRPQPLARPISSHSFWRKSYENQADIVDYQGLGASADAARMQRVVSFYERLPRGPAPEHKPSGLLQRYQHRYFNGKNPSAMPLVHVIGTMILLGYAQNYYFHLRHHKNNAH
ncbi:hypothetical protein D6D00_01117 [Aureobasidium pullulans]|nr:hypothetical protein D6D00_01117 [Aureobasidium pullulans]